MRANDSSEPSLFLASEHHRVHHEHSHSHSHNHGWLHRIRQAAGAADATETASASAVTHVIQTVSVVAQIDVDSEGHTFSVLTVLADATADPPQAVVTDSTPAPSTVAATASYSPSSAPSTAVDPAGSLSSSASATNASTSVPSTQSSSSSFLTTSHSTFISSSSSSSLTSHSTNSTSSTSTSTRSSPSASSRSSSRSTTSLITSTSSLVSTSSSIASTPSYLYTTSYSQSDSATSTDAVGGLIGGSASPSATATPSAGASGNGNNSGTAPAVSTSAVVGGVVGGAAGIAIVVALILFFVKWKRGHSGALLSLGSGRDGAGASAGLMGPKPQSPGGMTEQRSFFPAALAGFAGFKRSSQGIEPPVSERGFVRVSGRKLPSVLQHGGDGYGDDMPADTLSGSSYRDSQVFYGGPGTPTFQSGHMQRDSGQIGTPVMRPSPARTPVTEQGPFLDAPLEPPQRPDGARRAHSQDGSHTSRFTEEV